MQTLTRIHRLAKRLGIETKTWRQWQTQQETLALQTRRRGFYAEKSREEALEAFPELKAVYEVEDNALAFYQDVLRTHSSSPYTQRRNTLRAKAASLEAVDYLDKGEIIPAYERTDRDEEIRTLRAEEMQALRHELAEGVNTRERLDPGFAKTLQTRTALLSLAYFKNPDQAINDYPELAPLSLVNKHANRAFKAWCKPEFVQSAVKDCLHRAVHDIARNLPVESNEEIMLHAKRLRLSPLGNQSAHPNSKKSTPTYSYHFDLMPVLIGRNGLQTGFWPYEKDLYTQAEDITSIDTRIQIEQAKNAFLGLEKETVLSSFPKLAALYTKKEEAMAFYALKLPEAVVEQAANRLLIPDIQYLLTDKPVAALHEIKPAVHASIIATMKQQMRIPYNPPRPHETLHYASLTALTTLQIPPPVSTQEKVIAPLDNTDLPLTAPSVPSPSSPPFVSVDINTLRSTSGTLSTLHQLFHTPHTTPETQLPQTHAKWNIPSLTQGLNEHAEELVRTLLGEPLGKEKGQLRFGSNKGSLIVTLEGSKRGLWFDHQSGQGGNLLQLIQQEKQCSFKEALDFAGNFLGQSPEQAARSAVSLEDLPATLDTDKQKTIAYARTLANQSKPVKGTLAETYLSVHRGVNITGCSDCVRFLPSIKEPETGQQTPALLLIGKNVQGAVQGVQVIFLDEKGQKFSCSEPKRSYGIIKGSAIPIREAGSLYALAEGAETALSIATAFPELTVFASLGSMTNFSALNVSPKNNSLILFADNDGKNLQTQVKTSNAAQELADKGFQVVITAPGTAGQDFNDVLRARGVEGIRAEVKQAALYRSESLTSQTIRPAREVTRAKKHKKTREIGL